MANAVKEIGEIVKQCKVLLLDIEGTTTSISFVKDKLFPYAEEKVKQFLESQWETDEVKEAVAALRKLALDDKEKAVDGVVDIPAEDAPKEEQVEGLVKSVKWQMSTDRKVGPLKQLQGLIWKQGYDNGDIKGHVYDDVSAALEQWRSTDRQVYIYSSGSVQAQKLLFGQSSSGDLLKYIDGHFDTAVGGKQEPGSYTSIVEKIACKPEEILFLTDIVKEAEAARTSGLHVALVSREGNAPLPESAQSCFPVLHSLAQLSASNKRKPEPQDEQPAKLAKTDSVEATPAKTETETKETEGPEKMEVENGSAATEENKPMKENKTEEPIAEPSKVEIVVEEVTDPKTAEVVDVQPIVEEVTENIKEEEQKTKQNGQNGASEKKNGDVDAPIDEEAATVVTTITEIEGSPGEDVAEIIEGLEPVVEEPPADEEMQDLQNVGEVLEKECDEILSKVQDVTNLDSMPLKPLLNPIAEENMETENTDTSDIMDKILDSELEMEMKQCGEIDLNTVSELPDEGKSEVAEESPKEETSALEASKAEESKAAPEDTDQVDARVESSSTEKNVEENNKTETVTKPESPAEEANDNGKTEEVKADEETKLNGNATNGDADSGKLNGDSCKDELSSRLAVENGKVNGSNGDAEGEKGQGDSKVDSEVVDIKVKTVAVEEPRTDPIEQPTEA